MDKDCDTKIVIIKQSIELNLMWFYHSEHASQAKRRVFA